MLYKTILNLIYLGRTEGLLNKIEVLHTGGRLTDEQYQTLLQMLTKENGE